MAPLESVETVTSFLGSVERKELEREPKAGLGGSRPWLLLLLFIPASMYLVELAADWIEGEWELTDEDLEWLSIGP